MDIIRSEVRRLLEARSRDREQLQEVQGDEFDLLLADVNGRAAWELDCLLKTLEGEGLG